jgi:hypothetical protein
VVSNSDSIAKNTGVVGEASDAAMHAFAILGAGMCRQLFSVYRRPSYGQIRRAMPKLS